MNPIPILISFFLTVEWSLFIDLNFETLVLFKSSFFVEFCFDLADNLRFVIEENSCSIEESKGKMKFYNQYKLESVLHVFYRKFQI